MSTDRFKVPIERRFKSPGSRSSQHGHSRPSKVLAERNQAVVAVGAWVEVGQDFLEHPANLALLTEELQAQKRREDEDNLKRFQDEVRRRVTHQAHVCKRRQQPHSHPLVIPHRGLPHYQILTQQVCKEEEHIHSEPAAQQSPSPELSKPLRQVRLRLAACRLTQGEEVLSDLPGGRWSISPTRHTANACVRRTEEEQETRDVPLFSSQHECPLVQQKVSRHTLLNPNNSFIDHGSNTSLEVPKFLWPMTDEEKVKKQHQSQFLKHRRLVMNTEREQVKENQQLRKHLKRTARIKAEKEKLRQDEEMKLERARTLLEARQRLEERERQVLEQLALEEEEKERAIQLQKRKREEKERNNEKWKNSARFVKALRAQMKERLSQMKLELPTLCCCASSFWDSHPDTCANNCIFHNNPRAYAKALQLTLVNLDLQ
ncbi:coiled-coil domain-containing protein 15 isoform X2 [Poecilia formosa]|uniref:Coiled-coil domain containing 15 n=1 Tax=Poecilia formosa TaxID=48698 RepID=A0A096LVI1_POEFO|nr:PREDICTED: coiled-coil domain-containing protein 15 isoform X2 [Poecilia formosa]